jgi:hypothetical protein
LLNERIHRAVSALQEEDLLEVRGPYHTLVD